MEEEILDMPEQPGLPPDKLFFYFLVYFLFVYYLITQGINEIKYQQLIHQRKILKVYSMILTFLFFWNALPRFISAIGQGYNPSFYALQLLIMISSLFIFFQDFRYVLKRKAKKRNNKQNVLYLNLQNIYFKAL